MSIFYQQLAPWWHLISSPADYAEEAEFFLHQLAPITAQATPTCLELGSGGGNNAFHMKHAFSSLTLADLSPEMLAISKTINPECEHLQGDMRTIRLERTFDAVFIHDAIDYMTTLDDLRQAIATAFIHCKSGGMALFVPDHIRDTYESSTDHGGEDGDGRGIRYLEWSYDPDETDSTSVTDYVFIVQEQGKPTWIAHEQHTFGLFARDQWLELMRDVGFMADYVIDDYDRHLFIGHKP